MWPLILFGIGLWAVSKLVSSRGAVVPAFRGGKPATGLLLGASAPSAGSAASPSIAMTMHVGHYYAFSLVTEMSQTELMNALHEVGAFVQAALIPVPGVASGWSGVFEWSGAEGEPTENLPGITWTSITDLQPGGVVS